MDFNVTQLAKPVHEVTHPGTSGANHFGKRFLADLRDYSDRLAIAPKAELEAGHRGCLDGGSSWRRGSCPSARFLRKCVNLSTCKFTFGFLLLKNNIKPHNQTNANGTLWGDQQ